MAPLIASAAFFALLAQTDPVGRWSPYMEEASTRFGIPVSWIARVIRAESAGLLQMAGRPIRSRAGAIGLMQLMPATWATARARLGLGGNPDDPRDNILAGTFYLRMMYDRFGYPGLFGAYNAGPGRYAAYLAGRSALPRETRGYLGKVGPAVPTPSLAPSLSLFAVRHDQGDPAASKGAPKASLFAVRTDE